MHTNVPKRKAKQAGKDKRERGCWPFCYYINSFLYMQMMRSGDVSPLLPPSSVAQWPNVFNSICSLCRFQVLFLFRTPLTPPPYKYTYVTQAVRSTLLCFQFAENKFSRLFSFLPPQCAASTVAVVKFGCSACVMSTCCVSHTASHIIHNPQRACVGRPHPPLVHAHPTPLFLKSIATKYKHVLPPIRLEAPNGHASVQSPRASAHAWLPNPTSRWRCRAATWRWGRRSSRSGSAPGWPPAPRGPWRRRTPVFLWSSSGVYGWVSRGVV